MTESKRGRRPQLAPSCFLYFHSMPETNETINKYLECKIEQRWIVAVHLANANQVKNGLVGAREGCVFGTV